MENSYIAGFIDGEGYVGIYKINRGNKKQWTSKNSFHFRSVVEIANTNCDVIDFIHERFGGYKSITKASGARKKQLYKVRFYNNKLIKPLIDAIYPYLIVKKKHAEVFYEYLKTFNSELSENEILTKRTELYERMKSLNIKSRKEKV